jgi:hypothetical protein
MMRPAHQPSFIPDIEHAVLLAHEAVLTIGRPQGVRAAVVYA